MENSKHTKAKWAWQKFGNKYLLTAQHGMREIIIGASVVDREQGHVDCLPTMNDGGILRPINPDHPNAKVIAKSPELLESLKDTMWLLKKFERPYGREEELIMNEADALLKQLEK